MAKSPYDYNSVQPIIEKDGTVSQVFRTWMLRIIDAVADGGGGGSGTVSNLASAPTVSQVTITNSGGDDALILAATDSQAGVMTAAQVTALNDLAGSGLPIGGTTGQVLAKASGTDYDAVWQDEQDLTDYLKRDGTTPLTGDWATGAYTVNLGKALQMGSVQVLYDAGSLDGFTGSLFVGNGGSSLSHTAGTQGYKNLGIGTDSLLGITYGENNTGTGYSALRSTTSGIGNVANGEGALWSNTTGSYNNGIGRNALYRNTTGEGNNAIGNSAGVLDSSYNFNETGTNSIFIGTSASPNADGENNQIVIGHAAVGDGENSVVIGNDDITKTKLKGEVTVPDLSGDGDRIVVADEDGLLFTQVLPAPYQGSWETQIEDASNVQGTYTTQNGTYDRSGNMVFISANTVLATKGSMSGALGFINFPFPIDNASEGNADSYMVIPVDVEGVTTPNETDSVRLKWSAGDTKADLEIVGDYGETIPLEASHIDSDAEFTFSGVYRTYGGAYPAAPTDLGATAVSSTEIDLAWTDNADNETGYRVETSADGSTGWTTVTTLPSDSNSYSDTGLTGGTTYFYRVFAFNGAGDSAASNVDSATTAEGFVGELLIPPTTPFTSSDNYGITDEGFALNSDQSEVELDISGVFSSPSEWSFDVGFRNYYVDSSNITDSNPVVGLQDSSGNYLAAFSTRTRTTEPKHRYQFFKYWDGSAEQEVFIGYNAWKWRGQLSEVGSPAWLIQGIYVDDTYIYLAAWDGEASPSGKVFQLNKSTFAIVDSFTFTGKISSIDYDATHGWMMCRNDTNEVYIVDMAASLAGGTIDILKTMATGSGMYYEGLSSAAYYDNDGTTTILLGFYSLVALREQWLFGTGILVDGSDITGQTDPDYITHWFNDDIKMQSMIDYGDGKILAAHSGAGIQVLKMIDLEDFIDNGTAGDNIVDYTIDWWDVPTAYPEDMSKDPDGVFWMPVEGASSLGDVRYIYSFDGWKTTQLNEIVFFHDGSDIVVKVNGQEFGTYSVTGGLPALDTLVLEGNSEATVQYAAIAGQEYTDGQLETIRTTPMGLESQVVTLTNPGAESGSITGWTSISGPPGVVNNVTRARTGDYCFFGGPYASASMYQRVDIASVTGLTGGEIDSLSPTLLVKWWQASYQGSDEARIKINWRDSGLSSLGTAEGYMDEVEGFLHETTEYRSYKERLVSAQAPSGSRYADITMEFNRQQGTNSDGYIDDITAEFFWED